MVGWEVGSRIRSREGRFGVTQPIRMEETLTPTTVKPSGRSYVANNF